MSNIPGAGVSVKLLGHFSLKIGDMQVRKWRAGKARSLFQYLLANRGHVVSRDKLHEVLWPDREWSPNSSSLKVAMHALRQILQVCPHGSDPAAIRIAYRYPGYVLYADGVSVDADRFESLVEAGRAADRAGDAAAATASYRAAMDVYQGDFLAGYTANWIVEQREWYRSQALRVLDRLSTEALRRGDFADLARWCRRVIELDPYHESAYQLLMRVHGRFGEVGAVRGWHEICIRRLTEELGVAPSMETERIYLQAVRGDGRPGPSRQVALRRGSPVATPIAG